MCFLAGGGEEMDKVCLLDGVVQVLGKPGSEEDQMEWKRVAVEDRIWGWEGYDICFHLEYLTTTRAGSFV